MRPGDVVMTRSIEVRSGGIVKPTMKATFKSNPGKAMVFISCGSVAEGEIPARQAELVMEAMGWTPPPMVDGLDAGIAAAIAKSKGRA
jgi:hypothetical protein